MTPGMIRRGLVAEAAARTIPGGFEGHALHTPPSDSRVMRPGRCRPWALLVGLGLLPAAIGCGGPAARDLRLDGPPPMVAMESLPAGVLRVNAIAHPVQFEVRGRVFPTVRALLEGLAEDPQTTAAGIVLIGNKPGNGAEAEGPLAEFCRARNLDFWSFDARGLFGPEDFRVRHLIAAERR